MDNLLNMTYLQVNLKWSTKFCDEHKPSAFST